MNQREKLIELIIECTRGVSRNLAKLIADHLIANGVVVLPCRCKDCYYNDNESHDEIIWCNFHDTAMEIDGFCTRAKRKGGDE